MSFFLIYKTCKGTAHALPYRLRIARVNSMFNTSEISKVIFALCEYIRILNEKPGKLNGLTVSKLFLGKFEHLSQVLRKCRKTAINVVNID
ncbi:hypothetical protein DPMN_010410 [Dreissena polymorpha]|uniref:Uncharacterized protein n=1 Tax=Dreissena polymorpha TaxID=45954 RepID=A0A9D4N362_DREPO|nr:hypothetical protein DPMN_010410 [Dreissena polymorpha]